MTAEACPENTKSGATRAFIAIELPDEVKALISAQIKRLKGLVPEGVKWVDPRITHLTLAFLGNVPDTQLPVLSQITDIVAASSHPFTLSTGPLGAFPNGRGPRVLWLGLEGKTRLLSAIHNHLQDELETRGFSIERRPFKPHVTLGRVRGKGPVPLREEDLSLLPYESLEFQVRELMFMSSVLTPRGPIHTPLHRAPLSSEGFRGPTHC